MNTTLEIIITDEGKQDQVMIGGPVQGKCPVKSEHTAYRADRVVVRDLRSVSVKH